MFYYGETKRLTKGKIYVVLTRHPFELQLFKVEKTWKKKTRRHWFVLQLFNV